MSEINYPPAHLVANAAAARAARTRAKHARWISELTQAGYRVLAPSELTEIEKLVDTTTPEAIADVLLKHGHEEYGAHEMQELATLLGR